MHTGSPTINFITANATVIENNKAQLVCIATNDYDAIHELQVIWYKTTDGIKTSLLEKPRCHKCSNGTVSKQLLLDPVSHHDAGEYTCRAFNHHLSYRETTTFLTVECKLIHPTHIALLLYCRYINLTTIIMMTTIIMVACSESCSRTKT